MSEDASEVAVIGSWREAEQFAAQHMLLLGFENAAVTASGPDGGIDVVADGAVGQVKHYANTPVGSPSVQQLAGAAGSGKTAVFYALTGYTASAVRLGEESGVALFSYSVTGDTQAWSQKARDLVDYGYVVIDNTFTSAARDELSDAVFKYGNRVFASYAVLASFFPESVSAENLPFPIERLGAVDRHFRSLNKLVGDLNGSHEMPISKILAAFNRIEAIIRQLCALANFEYAAVLARAAEFESSNAEAVFKRIS